MPTYDYKCENYPNRASSSVDLTGYMKFSCIKDITVTEWSHHLDLTGDFSTLEYFALKHGFEIKKLDINKIIPNF